MKLNKINESKILVTEWIMLLDFFATLIRVVSQHCMILGFGSLCLRILFFFEKQRHLCTHDGNVCGKLLFAAKNIVINFHYHDFLL